MFLERFLLFLRRLFASKDVHYINGPDILPPPLSPDEEAELLRGYDGIDPAVKEILITRNLRLVVFIAKKYEAPGTGLEDIISIGSIGLIKAVNTFCPSKNIKLATYASRCIENEILMYLRKYSSLKNEVSIDEPLNFDPDGNELLLSDVLGTESDEITVGVEAEDEKKTLLSLVSELSLREREIMYMRFGIAGHEELTQKEVADKLGISQSYISRLEKRILKKLKVEFEALA